MTQQPSIGVSACLLGQQVRYDGQHKYHSIAAEYLRGYFHLIPVCPEVAVGMGVPRAKIQLTRVNGVIKLLGVEHPELDVTQAIKNQAKIFLNSHCVFGMVLKDKSPSCAVNSAKIIDPQSVQTGLGNGLFVDMIISLQPDLPLIQANDLQISEYLENFIERVWAFQASKMSADVR